MTSPAPSAARGRSTRQKQAVERALNELDDFVSAQQLHTHLVESGERISLATVYRALQQQAEAELVDVLRTDDGESVYRRCADDGHHHHLVCRQCWRTVEITAPNVESWAAEVAAQHGFTLPEHTVEVTGLCPQCAALTAS
ncbi:MAG: Fur family transcriptional regulator [Micrococcus sp.]|nr:Fur family transcriptional regulator [Micrococcus sp.]